MNLLNSFGSAYPSYVKSYEEIKHLVIAWLVLTFLFSFRFLIRNEFQSFLYFFIISLIVVGTGFVLHEMAHKYTAKYFGHWAEFRIWPQGLLLALLFVFLSLGTIIFAAPGATIIVPSRSLFGYGLSKFENGIISLAGPLTNLFLAGIFYSIQFFGGFLFYLGFFGFYINIWLAAFNLIPFGVLDGYKILTWNALIWAIIAIPTWALLISIILGILF